MKKRSNLVYAYLAVFVFSVVVAIYSTLRKGNAEPSLIISFVNNAVSSDSISSPKFWNNYPIMVENARNEPISTDMLRAAGLNIDNLILNGQLFFRCHFGQVDGRDDSLLAAQVIQNIQDISPSIIILTDRNSEKYLQKKGLFSLYKTYSHKLIRDIPIATESFKQSYFFRYEEGRPMVDIFVPRVEIPEVTKKYLQYQLTLD